MSFEPSQIAVAVLMTVSFYGIGDWVTDPKRTQRLVGVVGWLLLTVAPVFLFPHFDWYILVFGAVLGVAVYGLFRAKPRPGAKDVLFHFASWAAVAVAGALALSVIALFLFSVGLMGNLGDWTGRGYAALAAVPLLVGALMGVVRKWLRRDGPKMTSISLGGQGAAGAMTRDEIVLIVVMVPVYWGVLSSAFDVWNLVFLFGMVVLPSLFLTMVWSTLHMSVLSWFGRPRGRVGPLYEAYDALAGHYEIRKYMGEIVVEDDGDGGTFTLKGRLPGRHLINEAVALLEEASGRSVDASSVLIDEELLENMRFEPLLRGRRAS